MKKRTNRMKRIFALLLAFLMVADLVPAPVLEIMGGAVTAMAQPVDGGYELDNGYLRVTVSDKTGGFGIRTAEGDQVNKSDNDQYLVFEYDEDNTSFTSFQVTRNGETKEYIFGGKYDGSSEMKVSEAEEEILAVWSVDNLTFTQTIRLVQTGSNEHGTALISYKVENSGAPADIRCRMLVDTALGFQDYAYYKVGDEYLERETLVAEDGYNKSFYAVTDPEQPRITAYTINASIDDEECKPYQTIFGHWNNLASTVFDYTPDADMTFTNYNNRKYMTSDSAYALYFDLGTVAQGASASAATNYGVYSNESVRTEATVAVNVNAPDVLAYAKNADGSENAAAYENGGKFSVKTYIQNISDKTYEKVRIVVSSAGSIDPLDQEGNPTNSSYNSPYTMDILDVKAGEQLEIDWNFLAVPQEMGVYGKVQFKVYDVSRDATLGSGQIMQENLLGEGYSFVMCPGSVDKIPYLRFTGSSPETIFSSGMRTLYVTGFNFGMMLDKASYSLVLSRVDGFKINGSDYIVIPEEQFQIDDAANVLTVIFTDDTPGKLQDGMYQLTIDYSDTTKEDISGPALRFHVSSEEQYKNESYGFLAVAKQRDDSGNMSYGVRHFASEDAYWEEISSGRLERDDVLLEFVGGFIREEEDGSDVYTGVSLDGSNNVITLNGCLDIKNGTTTVTVTDKGSVTVDFDADLYTTGSGTSVWSGMCALTELEAGVEYNLIPYTENGVRKWMAGETIALIWPSAGKEFQSLMGLLFDFRYGELGTIAHEDAPTEKGAETRVLAFGAAMDLSFLIPESTSKTLVLGGRTATTKDILGSSWDAAEHNKIQFTPAECRALMKQADLRQTASVNNATQADVAAGRFSDYTVDGTPGYNALSIAIDDVLFGGEYLGVNMDLALGIPPYIQGLPALEGLLSIHTVGDWSFGVEGQCHFINFKMEAGISIKSKNDIPVVDSLRFFIGGITPGFNIDGVGVLWLQGAGGGIENLYDTIFLTDSIPPLKLIIQAQFSVMQIFSAIATMGISMRGVELTLTNGQFKKYEDETSGTITVPQPITMNAGIRLDWYPEFYFHGYVNMMLAMIINGGGYVVADAEGFYEFFLRAGISIPTNVPIIGGYSVADMNLGVNLEKIWGKMSLLDKLSIAMTYYWGGEIDWNSGEEVYPTYPELVGMSSESALMTLAVDENEETGEVLYMALGTNVRMSAASRGFAAAPKPVINDTITSDVVTGASHTMNLTKNGSGKMLSIQWTADSEAEAREAAETVVIADSRNPVNGVKIPIVIWDGTVTEKTNALFTYIEDTKTAYLTVVFDDTVYTSGDAQASVFDTTWNITTPEGTILVVYDVAPLPEMTVESAEITGDAIQVELGGSQLEKFTKLTVFAEGQNSGESYLLGGATDPFAGAERTLNLTMPAQAISDTYALRIIVRDDEGSYYSEADAEVVFVNPNQPKTPTGLSAENAGDYKVAVTASAEGEFDGYQFDAFDADGNPVTGMTDILMNKDGSAVSYDENGYVLKAESEKPAASYIIGGHFEQTVEDEDGEESILVTGFSAGTYTIEVRTWKRVADGAGVLVSEPATISVTVREPVKTVITAVAVPASGNSRMETITAGDGSSTYKQTSLNSSDVIVQLTADADNSFSGTWRLDGGYEEGDTGKINELVTTVNLPLTGLEDGVHILNFRGVNQYGDAVEASCRFTVDTYGPRLLLSAPVNGSLFDYWTGEVTISGITDSGVTMVVTDETTGQIVWGEETLVTDTDGHFAQKVKLDPSILSHDLKLCLKDALGNTSEKTVNVMSNGLGSIESLALFAGDQDVTNTELTAGGSYPLTVWAKLARPADAEASAGDRYLQINKAGMLDWTLDVAEGTANITDEGEGIMLTTSADAEGMITARFLVTDSGSYPVSAAFGYTGEQIKDLGDPYLQVMAADQVYTGSARTTEVEVWHKGVKLTEGTDYQIGAYTNHVDVTTEASKARVEIIGMGAYSGTAYGEFDISYLPLNQEWVILSGTEGNNGYYVSDVEVSAADGYVLMIDGKEYSKYPVQGDGAHELTFNVKRSSDGALTDISSLAVAIDKTAPTGTVTMDETGWSKFLRVITFGLYKVKNLEAEVTAEDENGIAKIEYAVSDTAYESVADLEAAGLTWSEYGDHAKPKVKENQNQIIYVRVADTAGNMTWFNTKGIHVDTVAPKVTVTAGTDVSSNGFSFALRSTEAGTYYMAVRKATEAAPSAEEIAGQALECAAKGSGTISGETAGTEIILTVNGLEANTAYVIYAVAEDALFHLDGTPAEPNRSAVATSNLILTAQYSLTRENTVITVDDVIYTGTERLPDVTVTYQDTLLVKDRDYEVAYHNNTNASSDAPYVEITGINDYAGVLTEGFAIEYLTVENGFILSGDHTQSGWYTSEASIHPASGYELVAENGKELTFTADGIHEAAFRIRRMEDGAMTDVQTLQIRIDRTVPEAVLTVEENFWKELLHDISFGLFFDETVEAVMTAEDSGSGIHSTYYLVSSVPVALDDLDEAGWTAYTEPVELASDGKYVVYGKAVDQAGNVRYLNSNGLVIDTLAPSVEGIQDGKVYVGEVTFTASDENLKSVTLNGENVTGTTITLKPAEGEQTIVLTDKAGNKTTVKVTVQPVPVEDPGCDGKEGCVTAEYPDLDSEAWYHLDTDYVIEQGLMQGYPDGTFRPDVPLTRAMIVQVLYNLEGKPAVNGSDTYTDTLENAWYADAVLWATNVGVVEGYGNQLFGPEDPVTREQMATIFYRYSAIKGYSLTEGNYEHFSDKADVSKYAENAMRWAVGNGLLIGNTDGTLQPQATTIRVQFAAMIHRFMEVIAK